MGQSRRSCTEGSTAGPSPKADAPRTIRWTRTAAATGRWRTGRFRLAARPKRTFVDVAPRGVNGPELPFAPGRDAPARHVEAAVRRVRSIPKTWNGQCADEALIRLKRANTWSRRFAAAAHITSGGSKSFAARITQTRIFAAKPRKNGKIRSPGGLEEIFKTYFLAANELRIPSDQSIVGKRKESGSALPFVVFRQSTERCNFGEHVEPKIETGELRAPVISDCPFHASQSGFQNRTICWPFPSNHGWRIDTLQVVLEVSQPETVPTLFKPIVGPRSAPIWSIALAHRIPANDLRR